MSVQLEDLEATFWQEVGRLQTEGPTQDEVDSARTIEVTRKVTGLQRLGGFGGIADTLNSYNQFVGDPGYLPRDIARYQAAITASVKQAANKYFNKNQAVVVSCVSGNKRVDDVPRRSVGTRLFLPFSCISCFSWRTARANARMPVRGTGTVRISCNARDHGAGVYGYRDSK